MIFKKIALIGVCALMLTACGNNDNSAKDNNSGSAKDTDYSSQNNSINHGITDTKQDSTTNKSEEQTNSDSSSADKNDQATTDATTTDDEKVGFELNSDGKVDEAKSVPADEKKAILAVFDEYINSFNDKDINRYGKTLSKSPKGFNYDEEIDYTKQAFKDYDVKRTAKNVTLKKYKENYAEVFANIKTTVKQDDQTFTQPLNQVTVMAKENGKWGISAVYVMGTKE
ncbi:nuclear transport factor 2 family protein [uncultured Rummeliibacillus sp.]|uniref:nuclear transport factor 2 family protein n=1 Tax=uncultured Rummeliibacillus sp. TaxID=762292 RepID=UPI00261A25D8|nr:nuclear transport factor 2 family protein [uncultured Rummeliibacillus sp.]